MKSLIYVGAGIGGFIGSYIPVLLGNSDFLSGWSILGSLIGGVAGVYFGYKLAKMVDG